jgi:hypothetical protein
VLLLLLLQLHVYTCIARCLGPRFGTLIWDPDFGTPIWDPNLGPQFGTPIWDPDLGPRFRTPIWVLRCRLCRNGISSNAMGLWVAFFMHRIFLEFFVCLGCFTRQCGLFKKSDPNPNAGHPICPSSSTIATILPSENPRILKMAV